MKNKKQKNSKKYTQIKKSSKGLLIGITASSLAGIVTTATVCSVNSCSVQQTDDQLKRKIVSLQWQIDDAKDKIIQYKSQIKEKEEKIVVLRETIVEQEIKIVELEESVQPLIEENEKLKKELEEVKPTIEALKKQLEEADAKYKALAADFDKAKAEWATTEAAYKKAIEEATAEKEALQKEYDAAKKTWAAQEAQYIAQLETANKQIEALTEELKEKDKKISDLAAEIATKDKKIAEQTAEITSLEETKAQLEKDKTALQAEVTKLNAKIDELNTQITNLETQKAALEAQLESEKGKFTVIFVQKDGTIYQPSSGEIRVAKNGTVAASDIPTPTTNYKWQANGVDFDSTTKITGTTIVNEVVGTIFTIDVNGLVTMTEAGKTLTDPIEVPTTVGTTTVKGIAADGCKQANTTKITFKTPANITTINANAFDGSKIESIEIPATITAIGASAFASCTALNSVTFATNCVVDTINASAFSGCTSLKSIIIPASVATIKEKVFENSGVTSVAFADTTATWKQDGYATDLDISDASVNATNFKDCSGSAATGTNWGYNGIASLSYFTINDNQLVTATDAAKALTGTLTIPEKVKGKTVKGIATSGCSSLNATKVVFEAPDNITTISTGSFSNSRSLTEIEIPKGVQTLSNMAFGGCWALATITFEENSTLTTIGQDTFGTTVGLTSISLPSGLKEIQMNAFSGSSITSVTFENTTRNWIQTDDPNKAAITITDATNNATYLKDVTTTGYTGTNWGKTGISVETGALLAAYDKSTISILADDECLVYATADGMLETGTITIPETMTIGGVEKKVVGAYNNAFSDITNMKGALASKIEFAKPENVYYLGDYAFTLCANLNEFDIPVNTLYLGLTLFGFDTSLKTVTIPNTITELPLYMFYGCAGLKSISLPDSIIEIDKGVFEGCISLTDITIPKNCTYIGVETFKDCDDLKTVTFADTTQTWKTAQSDPEVVDISNPTTNATNFRDTTSKWHTDGIKINTSKSATVDYTEESVSTWSFSSTTDSIRNATDYNTISFNVQPEGDAGSYIIGVQTGDGEIVASTSFTYDGSTPVECSIPVNDWSSINDSDTLYIVNAKGTEMTVEASSGQITSLQIQIDHQNITIDSPNINIQLNNTDPYVGYTGWLTAICFDDSGQSISVTSDHFSVGQGETTTTTLDMTPVFKSFAFTPQSQIQVQLENFDFIEDVGSTKTAIIDYTEAAASNVAIKNGVMQIYSDGDLRTIKFDAKPMDYGYVKFEVYDGETLITSKRAVIVGDYQTIEIEITDDMWDLIDNNDTLTIKCSSSI